MKLISCKAAREAGLKRYFTGLACPHGHIVERLVSTRQCVECAQAATAKWIKANSEVRRKWKVSRREADAPARRAWRIANPDKVKATKRKAYLTNREVIRRKNDEWAANNPDRVRKIRAQWEIRNPEKVRANSHRMRSMRMAAEGCFGPDDLRRLYEEQKGLCVGCRIELGSKYHVDHALPLALGGSNYIENIQLLCKPCNLSKGAKHPDVWANKVAV